MKNTVAVAILTIFLTACASSQTNPSDGTGDDSSSSASAKPAKKRHCSYERGASVNSRLQRVCRNVDES